MSPPFWAIPLIMIFAFVAIIAGLYLWVWNLYVEADKAHDEWTRRFQQERDLIDVMDCHTLQQSLLYHRINATGNSLYATEKYLGMGCP